MNPAELPEWAREGAATNPREALRNAINYVVEFPPSHEPHARTLLELASRQMAQPEWAGNHHLRQAFLFTKMAVDQWAAGKEYRPMTGAATRHMIAMGLPRTPRPPAGSGGPKGIAQAIARSIREQHVFGWDETPASQRMIQADRMIRGSLELAKEGDWEGANRALFKATLVARIAKESPLSLKEESQADFLLDEEIPRWMQFARSGLDQWITAQRTKAVREKISPSEPEEGEWMAGLSAGLTVHQVRTLLQEAARESVEKAFRDLDEIDLRATTVEHLLAADPTEADLAHANVVLEKLSRDLLEAGSRSFPVLRAGGMVAHRRFIDRWNSLSELVSDQALRIMSSSWKHSKGSIVPEDWKLQARTGAPIRLRFPTSAAGWEKGLPLLKQSLKSIAQSISWKLSRKDLGPDDWRLRSRPGIPFKAHMATWRKGFPLLDQALKAISKAGEQAFLLQKIASLPLGPNEKENIAKAVREASRNMTRFDELSVELSRQGFDSGIRMKRIREETAKAIFDVIDKIQEPMPESPVEGLGHGIFRRISWPA